MVCVPVRGLCHLAEAAVHVLPGHKMGRYVTQKPRLGDSDVGVKDKRERCGGQSGTEDWEKPTSQIGLGDS